MMPANFSGVQPLDTHYTKPAALFRSRGVSGPHPRSLHTPAGTGEGAASALPLTVPAPASPGLRPRPADAGRVPLHPLEKGMTL